MEEKTEETPPSKKEGILARFDEAGQVLFGGRLHTDREELEAAIEGGADSPKRHRGPVDVLQQTQIALLETQAKLTEAERKIAATSPLEGKSNETIVLSPGSALHRSSGLLPALVEGGKPVPTWSAPGGFVLYLEPGEDEYTGLVRELLVGSYRTPEDSDFEHHQGVFFSDPEWEFVSGTLKNRIFELETQIGFLAGTKQSEESKPRGESWLAERADSDAEKARMDAEIATLKEQLSTALGLQQLEAAPLSELLPANALELIQTAGGLSKPKAEAVLAALTTPAPSETPAG
jgi:hypothetical protein